MLQGMVDHSVRSAKKSRARPSGAFCEIMIEQIAWPEAADAAVSPVPDHSAGGGGGEFGGHLGWIPTLSPPGRHGVRSNDIYILLGW